MSICNPVFTRSSPPLLTVDDDTIAVVRRLCIDVNIILETRRPSPPIRWKMWPHRPSVHLQPRS
jgi:hypothetical protein